jgi:hypothetical protein
VNGETTTDNLLGSVLNEDNQVFFKAAFPDEFISDLVTMDATVLYSKVHQHPLLWYIHPVIERLFQTKRLDGVPRWQQKLKTQSGLT